MPSEFVLLPIPSLVERHEGAWTICEGDVLIEGASAVDRPRLSAAARASAVEAGKNWPIAAGRGGGDGRFAVRVRIDANAITAAQSYRLIVAGSGVRILAGDAPGAFYGLQTLRQLVRQARGNALPCVRIEDRPDFAQRGVMWDISRDRVLTMDTLFRLVDLLAQMKINQLQLYTEHTFAYSRHRVVWEKASPMTAQEILELDAYCADRFVELVPNQNSFGHYERWLKHDVYKPLAECPEGYTPPWGGHSPVGSVLCPTDPGSAELIAGLYDELLPNFASTQINVGCDETWELGKGRSRAECERKGTERVYLEFLAKIHKLAAERGRTIQFWGDIILHRPELIAELPDGVIALDWGYEANRDFDETGEKFASSGVPYYVCPGTSSWNTLAGRTYNARPNLLNAAENGLRHGAIGFLNTNWGDGGHVEPLPVSYYGLAYGAAVSWAVSANRDIDLATALDTHVFLDDAGVMGRFVTELGALCREAHIEGSNDEFYPRVLTRPGLPIKDGKLSHANVPALDIIEPRIDELGQSLNLARLRGDDAGLVVEEYRLVADLMRLAVKAARARLVANCSTAELPADTRKALCAEYEPILDRYPAIWRARSREGGLSNSLANLRSLRDAYKA
ncbi:MAG: family 20 glycosylhydrolase [Capsulimonadaceae bacterium]|nr:family 20 glycosylhydrolase [Capsulimonadaceae bacterium]